MNSFSRELRLPTDHSFFLFGARGTGKSTLLNHWLQKDLAPLYDEEQIKWIDLLDPEQEERYALNPARLKQELEIPKSRIKVCVIDEVQKIPALLDVAHGAIQRHKIHFALTGSSARKLKRSQANLLAGRAFDLRLGPLSKKELGFSFDLDRVLRFGSLPGVFAEKNDRDRERFLVAYARTYLKEEIQAEQIVRDVLKFRRFLQFASQMNTKILSFSKLSHSSGVDAKSISRYFEILEDTLIGIFLEPFDRSIRVRQSQKPKFYLFDTGLACQMREDFTGVLRAQTSLYGELFEQWFITECHRRRDALEGTDEFFFLRTKDDAEIDLILVRRGMAPILMEIKSSDHITDDQLRSLVQLKRDIKHSRALVVSREAKPRLHPSGVEILPYATVLDELFGQ